MNVTDTTEFKPSFCHRSDCKADPGSPFCAACGADIAAYRKELTGAHPVVAGDLRTQPPEFIPTVTKVLAGPALNGAAGARVPTAPATPAPVVAPVTAPAKDPAAAVNADSPRTAPWRDRVVIAAFAIATVVGAAAALVTDLA
jgi:hypothetical protein